MTPPPAPPVKPLNELVRLLRSCINQSAHTDCSEFSTSKEHDAGIEQRRREEQKRVTELLAEVEALLLQRAQAIAELQPIADVVAGALKDYWGDLTKEACDACAQCSPLVMCAFHSLLSVLARHVPPAYQLEVEGRLKQATALLTARAQAIAQGQAEVEQLKATNTRLHRRCQLAEAAVDTKVEDFEKRSTKALRALYFERGRDYERLLADAARVARAPQPEQEHLCESRSPDGDGPAVGHIVRQRCTAPEGTQVPGAGSEPADSQTLAAPRPASAALPDVREVYARMWEFATTKPSPQQTRQKSAREMVELFAQELAAALARAEQP